MLVDPLKLAQVEAVERHHKISVLTYEKMEKEENVNKR